MCSVCRLFTSKEVSYVSVGKIIHKGGMKAVRSYYESLGTEYVEKLNEMIVFDAIICNTDRHFGDFGLLVNSKDNSIIGPAPLFDHGNSLFNFAGEENWQSEQLLNEYIDTLLPQTYDEFIEEARKYMDDKLKKKVRKLLSFELVEIGKYNYSGSKLAMISKEIRRRAQMLLE